jgi:hypothetical protein
MSEVLLNEHGERCGDFGASSEVWTLGEYSVGNKYFIDTESIDPGFRSEEGDEHGGTVRLPVQSVGKLGERFYFATDLRFAFYPGADCVFPDENELTLNIYRVGGGWRGSLRFRTLDIVSSTTQFDREDVIAFLALWAGRQEPGRFIFPDEIIEVMKLAAEAQATTAVSGDPMDAAFGSGE